MMFYYMVKWLNTSAISDFMGKMCAFRSYRQKVKDNRHYKKLNWMSFMSLKRKVGLIIISVIVLSGFVVPRQTTGAIFLALILLPKPTIGKG